MASRYTKEEVRMRNMEIIHHSFTYVLARFNELHDVAKERVCPDGRRRKTRLFLYMIPGDMKEHWALTCMTHKYCHMCKVPKVTPIRNTSHGRLMMRSDDMKV